MAPFKGKNSPLSKEEAAELESKLNTEATRVYDFIDRSILRERIRRAKYTFWAVTLATLLVVGIIFAVTKSSALVFISPFTNGIISWITSIATIPVSYNQRVKGAMISTIGSFIKDLERRAAAKKMITAEKKLENSQAAIIAELQIQVSELKAQVATLVAAHRVESPLPLTQVKSVETPVNTADEHPNNRVVIWHT